MIVSVVHVTKGALAGAKRLDGREVDMITAFLVHRGGHDDPKRLAANRGKSFIGSYVLGMGFTFDDADAKGVASTLDDMRQLTEANPANAEAISPYIGGQEINTSPNHEHHRYAINFGQRGEEECRQRWPDLMAIVEAKVRPTRLTDNRASYRRYWWQYAEKRLDLQAAIVGIERVLAISLTTSHIQFAFQPTNRVFGHTVVVVLLSSYAAFCALQSRPHEVWARFFGSSLKDDLRYTPSDCFENFPFPEAWETDSILESVGRAYYDFRAELMFRNYEGLTKTYNRFHYPEEQNPDILTLRSLHAEMDRAVLDAYGWHDIPTECEFLLDYEVEDDESGRIRKPYRYRWPDEIRDEVLARLIELNGERAAAERRERAGHVRSKKTLRPALAAAGALDNGEELF